MNPSNTVTSEPQRQPNVGSAAAAKTVARPAQSKTSAKARSRPGKAGAKTAPAKRTIKRRQTEGSKQDRVIALAATAGGSHPRRSRQGDRLEAAFHSWLSRRHRAEEAEAAADFGKA